jgi:hypothetical protein
MVRRRAWTAGCDADALLGGVAKVRGQLKLRMEPFEEEFGG